MLQALQQERDHVKSIKRTTDLVRENLREARCYIEDAYRHKESSKPMADWFRDMAVGHMGFIQKGHQIAKDIIAATRVEGSDLAPGMLAVYDAIHADLIAEAAEINAMISAYK